MFEMTRVLKLLQLAISPGPACAICIVKPKTMAAAQREFEWLRCKQRNECMEFLQVALFDDASPPIWITAFPFATSTARQTLLSRGDKSNTLLVLHFHFMYHIGMTHIAVRLCNRYTMIHTCL